MRVADFANCEPLYRRSGWKHQYWWWALKVHEDHSETWYVVGEHDAPFATAVLPAYDAHYLSQMLPRHTLIKNGNGNYIARWQDYTTGGKIIDAWSNTNPANALARLALMLFEQGILRPDE